MTGVPLESGILQQTLFALGKNIGLIPAQNFGIVKAKGKYVFLSQGMLAGNVSKQPENQPPGPDPIIGG